MRKTLFIGLLLFFIYFPTNAQVYVEPIIGYQIDMTNHPRLNQLNTSVQFAFKTKRSELLLTLQKSWGLNRFSTDSSFTLNPALPLSSPAHKKISPNSFSFLVTRRSFLFGNRSGQHVSFLSTIGIEYQQIHVHYTYDKNDYVILNPDKTIQQTSWTLGAGLEYMLPVKSGRFFTQLIISAFTVTQKINYPTSFGFTNPLSVNIGYSFLLKKHHAKK